MAVPLLAVQLQQLIGRRQPTSRSEVAALGGLVTLALVALTVAVPTTAATPPPQPQWVDTALASLPPGTTVLDEPIFGGYLMWRFPSLDFTYSGYGDIYTRQELEDMSSVMDLEPGWEDLVRESQAAYAVLDPESPLAYALRSAEGWRVVHDDREVQMLRAPEGWMDE